jgi:hypothetical protein
MPSLKDRHMDTQTVERLKTLVALHHVCWDVVPLQATVGEEIRSIGFEVHLLGVHEDHHPEVRPGCAHCRQIFHDLSEIARAVLPEPGRRSKYDIDTFDGALRYPANEKLPPVVRVLIEIRHRAGWDAPIDECEQTCLKDITDQLTRLGAPHRRWPAP